MKHPTTTTTTIESSLSSSKRGSKIFGNPIGAATTTKSSELRRTSINTHNNIINSLSGIPNRSTLLNLTLEDEESDGSDQVIEKTTTHLNRTITKMNIGGIST